MKAYHIYYSYKDLPDLWDRFVIHDILLQRHYLKAVEKASPSNIQWFYVGIYENQQLVGIAIVQRVQLYLKDLFRQTKVSCLKEFFRNVISKVLKGNVLVVGNLTHTGQHGMLFRSDKITYSDFLNLVQQALDVIKGNIKQNQQKTIRAILFKDYYEDDLIHNEQNFFEIHQLHKLSVQPNMIMPIRPNWLSNADYIKNFSKKYRDRYKRARRKLGAIKCYELNEEAIKDHSKRLYDLYLNVSTNAKFNTFLLPENHFYGLKTELKEAFKVYGYFLNEELVGFYTLILNGTYLETYFLGYDIRHQYPYQLYLNMLFDMAKFAIEYKFENVIYARTAMEIKSSVGAVPKPMIIYLKHTNPFLNAILKQLVKFMDPTQKWEQRHPFV